MDFSDADREALAAAVRRLEAPRFVGRMAALAGRPAELMARALPAATSGIVAKAAESALTRALGVALFSLRGQKFVGGRAVHSALASASGAVGGAFGLAALPIELPVSTAIMLRTIASIAREEGEDLADPGTRLACLEVFALGHTGADRCRGRRSRLFRAACIARPRPGARRRYRRAQGYRAWRLGAGASRAGPSGCGADRRAVWRRRLAEARGSKA